MNFSTISKCIDALNKTSPFEIKVIQSEEAGCELYSSKDEYTIILGNQVEILLYLYCYASKDFFRKYLCQSIYARYSMYEKALHVLRDMYHGRTLVNSTYTKIKQNLNNDLLYNMTMLSIFHEIAHIVFSVDKDTSISYFTDVHNRVESLKSSLEMSYSEDNPIVNQLHMGIKLASEDELNTAEEIACDCYAIDVIFKLNGIFKFSTKQVLNYCLAAINLLTCMYQVEFLNRTARSDDNAIFDEVLAKFSIRRTIAFSRMMDVLSDEYGVNIYKLDKMCRKIAPSIQDILHLKRLAETMAIDINNRDWRVRDENKHIYLNELKEFEKYYTTN